MRRTRTGLAIGSLVIGLLVGPLGESARAAEPEAGWRDAVPGDAPNVWAVTPFAGLLAAIAVLPIVSATAPWWDSNRNRLIVSLGFSAATIGYYLWGYGATKVNQVLEHAVIDEYLPFMVLLFCLYVISGGVCLRGDLPAHPVTNTVILGIGALLASFIGTTGASMVLIRPLLQTNAERKHVTHTVIFFIFLVSNVGGCLLPIGDPPLFLGYLRGVPFLWTVRLWAEWATTSAILLAIYFAWDTYAHRRETRGAIAREERVPRRLRLSGRLNLLWLVGVVLAVALIYPGAPIPLLGWPGFPFLRELIMLAFVGLSLWLTPRQARIDNGFNYHAIAEVAALFIGIFITMQPPLEILRTSGPSLASILSSPERFFWATGSLSSFLDNAPTYAVFFETALAIAGVNGPQVVRLVDGRTIDEGLLVAISLGAVFMGAMTYIGNGPNFMVKSIAQRAGVRMPSFFGYMGYSVSILVPLFLVVTWLFL